MLRRSRLDKRLSCALTSSRETVVQRAVGPKCRAQRPYVSHCLRTRMCGL